MRLPLRSISAAVFAGTAAFGIHAQSEMNKHEQVVQDNLADENALKNADILFVPAGGKGRIKHALEIAKPGQKVIISGAKPGRTLDQILTMLDKKQDDLAIQPDDVTILSRALNTKGDLLELRNQLAFDLRIENVVIVTSDYHAPRVEQIRDALEEQWSERLTFHYETVKDEAPTYERAETVAKETVKVGLYGLPLVDAKPSSDDLRPVRLIQQPEIP